MWYCEVDLDSGGERLDSEGTIRKEFSLRRRKVTIAKETRTYSAPSFSSSSFSQAPILCTCGLSEKGTIRIGEVDGCEVRETRQDTDRYEASPLTLGISTASLNREMSLSAFDSIQDAKGLLSMRGVESARGRFNQAVDLTRRLKR